MTTKDSAKKADEKQTKQEPAADVQPEDASIQEQADRVMSGRATSVDHGVAEPEERSGPTNAKRDNER